jgi:propionyl-CoA carboxylase beta chain
VRVDEVAQLAQVNGERSIDEVVGCGTLERERGRRRHGELLGGHREVEAGTDHDRRSAGHDLGENAGDLGAVDLHVVRPLEPDRASRQQAAHRPAHREPGQQRHPSESLERRSGGREQHRHRDRRAGRCDPGAPEASATGGLVGRREHREVLERRAIRPRSGRCPGDELRVRRADLVEQLDGGHDCAGEGQLHPHRLTTEFCGTSTNLGDGVVQYSWGVTDDEKPDLSTTAARLADLKVRYHEAVTASGEAAIAKQHAKGKKTARERIDALLDHGSFVELDEFVRHRTHAFGMERSRPYGDAVVTGLGTIHGRQVAVYSQDFTIFGGSLGEVAGEKIIKVMDHAIKTGVPIIGMLDSGGARIQEGVVALGKYGEIFRRNTQASGVIPQISIIMGPAAGGAVYSPALTDFVIMVDKTSQMFVTGPDVIKTVTGEDVGMEELGGALTHNKVSGVAHYLASDEDDALDYARTLVGFLPDNNLAEPQVYESEIELEITDDDRKLNVLIPDSPNQPYDVKTIIEHIVDNNDFLETQPLFAPNIVVGFGRVEGRTIGVIANQPNAMAGTLNIEAGEKAARFVRFCDAFNIPILTLVDVPGYLPGTDQEWTGVIRRGAKLLYAYAEATVPLVTVITRKAYGGAYIVMGSKQLGADLNYAWPTAEIAVMGGQGAVNILYRGELKAAEEAGEDVAAVRTRLANEYTYNVASPFLAAERGELDGVIEPAATRVAVIKALRALRTKRASLPPKKHGNIPL